MQINPNINTTAGINISGQTGISMGLADLAEGDSITCRVIFSGDGTAHLKTGEGGLIRARLNGNISLPEGSQVTLMVEEKTADNITLRITGVSGGGEAAAAAGKQPALPPALAAVFEQIQAANLPAEAKVELFTKALADFPGLNSQSPAVAAALATLTGQGGARPPAQVGLGQMLVELAVLISNVENAGSNTTTANTATANAQPNTQPNAPAIPTTPTAPTAPAAPAAPATPTQPAQPVVPAAPNATPPVTAAQPGAPDIQIIQTAPTPPTIPNAPAAPTTNAPAPPVAATPNAPTIPNAPNATPPAAPIAPTAAAQPVVTIGAAGPDGPQVTAPPVAAPQVAPPPEALLTVRQMIGELYPPGGSEPSPKELTQFIGRLFAHVGRTVEQGGEQLQKCARELEVRLHLLKEAISQSSLPQKEELLSQTNRILQQTETLREARLLCLQIPIQFEQQKQTAELYIYRRERRPGQKLDPQNATILLALNTEHLGRLEALIQTRGKEINLKLEISRAEAVPLVREYSRALPRLLQETGFKLNSASVEHLQKERRDQQAAEKALVEYQRNFDGKLDFFI